MLRHTPQFPLGVAFVVLVVASCARATGAAGRSWRAHLGRHGSVSNRALQANATVVAADGVRLRICNACPRGHLSAYFGTQDGPDPSKPLTNGRIETGVCQESVRTLTVGDQLHFEVGGSQAAMMYMPTEPAGPGSVALFVVYDSGEEDGRFALGAIGVKMTTFPKRSEPQIAYVNGAPGQWTGSRDSAANDNARCQLVRKGSSGAEEIMTVPRDFVVPCEPGHHKVRIVKLTDRRVDNPYFMLAEGQFTAVSGESYVVMRWSKNDITIFPGGTGVSHSSARTRRTAVGAAMIAWAVWVVLPN